MQQEINNIMKPAHDSVMEQATNDPNISNRIAVLAERIKNTSDTWAKNFLASVEQYFGARGGLTFGQYNALARLELRYNEQYLDAEEEFKKSFTDEMRADLKILVDIYAKTNYFSELVRAVKADGDHTPSRQTWESFRSSKYAIGYLENYKSKPRYQPGQLVIVKEKSWGYYYLNNSKIGIELSHAKAMIMQNSGILPNTYGKGGKVYAIQSLLAPAQTYYVEERHLKKNIVTNTYVFAEQQSED